VAAAFGYFIAGNLLSVAAMVLLSGQPWVPVSDDDLRSVIVYELALFAVLLPFLHLRGWRLGQIGIDPGAKDTLVGIGLVFALLVIGMFVELTVVSIIPGLAAPDGGPPFAAKLSLWAVVAVSVVNPIFEELFVCGYVMTALKEHFGLATAINTSVALRMAYHLYQGPSGVIGIIPLGLVFAYWYGRTGRLWPLIVAHMIFDLFALLQFVPSF
jgi:CAAX protease family protein